MLKMKVTCAILLCLCSMSAYAQSGLPVLQAGTVSLSGEKGVLKQQFTEYPGNEAMQKRIEAAL
jgi:hypothetical protein